MRREFIGVGIIYALATGLVLLASTVRPRGLWAFSAASYFGDPWAWAPAAAAVLWAAAVLLYGRRAGDGGDASDGGRRFAWWAVSHTALMAALFIGLRARTHFLGDGYTLLGTYATENPLIKSRALGEALVHLWVRDLVGGPTKAAALLSFQVLAVGAGLIYLGLVWWAAARLFEHRRERLLFAVGMTTPGYMLLYCGYVELYALFVTAVAAFGLVGLLAAEGRIRRWWILAPLAAAALLHVMGVVLIPAAVFLLLADTGIGRALGRASRGVKAALAVGLLAAVLAVFRHAMATWSFFRLAFLPPTPNRFTVGGYTLFSDTHLLDFVNQALVLFPGLLVCVPALMPALRRRGAGKRAVMFLALFGLGAAGAVFIFDPKLGMPRDWDLFAFAGVPIALVCLYPLVRRLRAVAVAAPAVLLALGLNVIILGGRAALQTAPEASADQFQQLMNWDLPKSQISWTILVSYYLDRGDSTQAQELYDAWLARFPGYLWNRDGLDRLHEGKYPEALALFRQVMQANPAFSPAYGNLGATFLAAGRLDSAEIYIDIALGMSPHQPVNMVNRGKLLWLQGDKDGAVKWYRRALAMDSTEHRAALGLADYYRDKRDRDLYFRYLELANAYGGAPPGRMAELGTYFLATGRRTQGEECIRRAVEAGLDSATTNRLRELYPDLGL
ncbi:MAG TPA: tetratricopeptide repeat protein [candidate division Zixibacteria bacterium]|nr:tetratricopeptide repeat protein [candidate division Zixibacteria bacterium]MDD4918393.1 tetratricopeptide repeat protein [candidate division Zixibacteria bacterium]MDM7972415.1 tetratricopeptide repeat protein [candidate division Zixibacteria bacterium]HOZ07970.1 tetratricopeptide repeat protein [candidate division Zixibacteria bacterium]HPM38272.1 tetratricopeptide repeat protein [candidate division Zixibacteria bacterium]